MHDHMTSLEIQQQLLDQAIADGTVKIVGATDDGRVLFERTE